VPGECRSCDILSKKRDLGKIRYKRFEKLETLWDEIIVQELGPRDIAPRPWEAVDESCGDKILVGATDHDGDGFRFPLKDLCQARARDEQYIDLARIVSSASGVGGAASVWSRHALARLAHSDAEDATPLTPRLTAGLLDHLIRPR